MWNPTEHRHERHMCPSLNFLHARTLVRTDRLRVLVLHSEIKN